MAISNAAQKSSIRTKRLYLRAAQESDLDDLFEIFSNEEAMRYWSSSPHPDKVRTQEYLQNMITSWSNGLLDFSIVLSSHRSPADGKVIGKAGIWNADEHEIGLILNQLFWGKGYMSEALAVLLPYFWEHGVQRIVADVDPRNDACIGLLRKFGFEETGRAARTFETHLGWCDSIYFALKKPKS